MVSEDAGEFSPFHDKSKFCEFHNDHGHYMIDYRQLKVEIAQFLRKGYLKEFLSERGKAVMDKGKIEETPPPQTLRIVHTISGGSNISYLTMSATSSHIQKVNLVVPEYEVSDLEYEHSLTFFSH